MIPSPPPLTYRQAEVCLALMAAGPAAASHRTLSAVLGVNTSSIVCALRARLANAYGRHVQVLTLDYGSVIIGEPARINDLHDHCMKILASDGADRLIASAEDSLVGDWHRKPAKPSKPVDTPVDKRWISPTPAPRTVAQIHNISLPKISIQRGDAA